MPRVSDRSSLQRLLRHAIEPALVLVVLAAWAATWLPRLQGPIDLRWDAAVYYTLGTSIAEGKGYRLLNEPGEIAAIQYPPGLPAIIALHQKVLGTSDPVVVGRSLRRSFLILSGVCVLLVYWLLRSRLPTAVAAGGTLMCALGMTFVWLTDRAYSDVPFLTLTVAFLLLAQSDSIVARVGAGAAASAAFLLRTVGGALLVAWVLDALIARRVSRAAVRLALTAALIAGWQGYVWHVQHSAAYAAPAYSYQRAPYLLYNVSYGTNAALKDPFAPELGHATWRFVRRFVTNALSLPEATGEALTMSVLDWSQLLEGFRKVPILGLATRWLAIRAGVFILGVMALAGIAFLIWQRDFPAALVALVYIIGLSVMNFTQELVRYMSGIAPVLLLLLFTPLVHRRGSATTRTVGGVVAGAILLISLAGQIALLRSVFAGGFPVVTYRTWNGHQVAYRLFSYSDAFRDFDEGIDWLSAHAREPDIVASSQPHWVYLRTGLRAVMPPFESDPARQQALLDEVPISFVIVDSVGFSATRQYSLPALKNGHLWELVHQSPDGSQQIYKRCQTTPSC